MKDEKMGSVPVTGESPTDALQNGCFSERF